MTDTGSATASAKASQTRAETRSALQVCPVVLAGGAGSRLWPLSREQYPKQMINLVGEQSLLASTAGRLDALAERVTLAEELLIVCNEEHRFTTADQVRATGKRARLILEPVGRDTAPALTIAAMSVVASHEDGILVVMPADHALADLEAFQNAVAEGVRHAANGQIVTMGIVPTHPEVGYGYIHVGEPLASTEPNGARRLNGFVEKPYFELAQQYVASQRYWWNSGIFIVRASTWLKAIRHFHPAIYAACAQSIEHGKADGDFFRVDSDAFARSPSNSIDYAVMEPLAGDPSVASGVVVPLTAGWTDLGSWDTVWQVSPKDDEGNVAQGRVMFEGATDTFAHADGRLVACLGTKDLVIVETPDALLVADRSRAQDVKKIVQRLKQERRTEAVAHRLVHRPWGHYDSVDSGERFQVKRIVVEPGARLSLQMHHHRAEHWVVVRGTALVTRGEERFIVSENESAYIPLGVSHRLENPGKMPLEIIEVQSGSYLGEDDIVRLDDQYGRQ
ncbi:MULTISPECIES: mannose-1-phosphate guanylyltransferase/mannose-6-phosphate isomerase [unclassified Paraburkholderia]|uniref:mannose-1-phosphate guanylyltransferase/mannose-6-phosphate isomerase n=1 Tax=unclassified Paraburkholderia TaxID=2615204 RepID=UPI002AB77F93|nr:MULTISPECIES: mannose-1-phosphate guanylyltransferase/mannose-6-phosphate isomerase [unclassified Paraburkholderia]